MNDKEYAEYLALLTYTTKIESLLMLKSIGICSDNEIVEGIREARKELEESMEDLEQ